MENVLPSIALFVFVYLLLGCGVLQLLYRWNRMNRYRPAYWKLVGILFWLPAVIIGMIMAFRAMRAGKLEEDARQAAIADYWEDRLNGK